MSPDVVLESEVRTRDKFLLRTRCFAGQAGSVDDEVEVVRRAAEERVRLTRLNNQGIAFSQLDCLITDTDGRGAARNEIDLGYSRVNVWFVHALIREADRDCEVAVPRAREPALRVVIDALASHPLTLWDRRASRLASVREYHANP